MGNMTLKDTDQIFSTFTEGNLLARAHFSDIRPNMDATAEEKKDIKNFIRVNVSSFMHELQGINANPNEIRAGNRTACTSLMVPNTTMPLFHDIGILHDSNACTMRAYFLKDAATTAKSKEYGNVLGDMHKAEPILSKEEFIRRYQQAAKANDGSLRINNEVIASIFPESVMGIVINPQNKQNLLLRALCVQNEIKEQYGIDYPMFLYSGGKFVKYTPSEKEILAELNQIPQLVNQNLESNRFKKYLGAAYDALPGSEEEKKIQLYNNMLSQAGYELASPNITPWKITADNLWKKGLDENKVNLLKSNIASLESTLMHEKARIAKSDTNDSRIHEIDSIISNLNNVKAILNSKSPLTNKELKEGFATIESEMNSHKVLILAAKYNQSVDNSLSRTPVQPVATAIQLNEQRQALLSVIKEKEKSKENIHPGQKQQLNKIKNEINASKKQLNALNKSANSLPFISGGYGPSRVAERSVLPTSVVETKTTPSLPKEVSVATEPAASVITAAPTVLRSAPVIPAPPIQPHFIAMQNYIDKVDHISDDPVTREKEIKALKQQQEKIEKSIKTFKVDEGLEIVKKFQEYTKKVNSPTFVYTDIDATPPPKRQKISHATDDAPTSARSRDYLREAVSKKVEVAPTSARSRDHIREIIRKNADRVNPTPDKPKGSNRSP